MEEDGEENENTHAQNVVGGEDDRIRHADDVYVYARVWTTGLSAHTTDVVFQTGTALSHRHSLLPLLLLEIDSYLVGFLHLLHFWCHP